MRLPSSVDVLVTGAGPSGLALATTLAQLVVPFLVIDQQPAGANTSRACVIHARTLEVLEPLAVVPEVLARGIEVPIFCVRDRDRPLLSIDFRQLRSRYPYTLMLPQSDTEAVLLAALRARDQCVWRPCELIALHNDANGMSAKIRTKNGDHVVQANYVVGCDGMHSVVREQAGVSFDGDGYDEAFVLADVHMDWPLARDEVTLFYAPAGLMVVAPIPGGRFRIVATVKQAPSVPSISDIQALVETRGPAIAQARVRDIVWSSRFHVQHRVARTFREGRILLAGDAAHVHSPAGGQGMNTGIQDAVSLGTALAETLRGGSDLPLTEWAEHRSRVAADIVTMTDRMTRAATIESPLGQAIRNAVVQFIGHFPAARQAIAMKLAELSQPAA